MNVKNALYVITAAVSNDERQQFSAIAHDFGVSCSMLLRRLVQYFLDGKISWNDLFKQSQKLPGADETSVARRSYMRTRVKAEQYTAFAQLAEGWGSTAAVVLRRLVLLYIAGDIERRDIW